MRIRCVALNTTVSSSSVIASSITATLTCTVEPSAGNVISFEVGTSTQELPLKYSNGP
ncbi:hypothetical protein [Halarcobacter anaerophilus]|uniref:hypothetical protein n=1 Tax=Halarcobacter anaerophilus TaxID=877500 RepID=UPI0012FEFD78|nr:hypothetical protein [Halarcobacter anaerophilus]